VVVEVSDKSKPALTGIFEKAGFKIALARRFDEEETFFKKIIFTQEIMPPGRSTRKFTGTLGKPSGRLIL
jgi:hypothetical protein